jgi:hypothetical protein
MKKKPVKKPVEVTVQTQVVSAQSAPPPKKLTHAERIMALFAGSEAVSGTHGMPDLDGVKWSIKKTARTLKGPVTVELWQQHIRGERPLGIVPIRDDSTCLWGSIDIDQYDLDLTEVVKRVEHVGLPLVPCRSKSGGLHLFIFFVDPIDAAIAQDVLRNIAASLGFAGSEIFPKQTKILAEHGDQGNWIVMPYFGGDYGGKLKMQHGIKKSGLDMTIGEFLTMAETRRVTSAKLAELTVAPVPVAKSKANGNGQRHATPYGDGPPCLQHLAVSGFPEGGRNNALFHIGVYLKKAHPSEWEKHLEHDNQLYMKPPLPADEVDMVKKSLRKKDYEYKCKDQPMASHCNSTACRGRKHGVGVGGAYPEILGIDKLDSDPPVWFVQIPGARIPMATEDLQNYYKFHKMCMAHANICYKMISQPVWFSIIGDAMQRVKVIAASDDVSTSGVFLEMLETFLTNRMRGKTKEDLLRGVPWEDEEAGRHYFSMSALEKFLQREGWRNVERPMLKYRIEKLGGGNRQQMNIKGKNRGMWFVPVKAIEGAPELDAPEISKEAL